MPTSSAVEGECARRFAAVRAAFAANFVDHGISGTKEKRPALDKLMVEIKARRVDVVIVAAFDRLGRSVRHLVEVLELFRHLNCRSLMTVDGIHDPEIAALEAHIRACSHAEALDETLMLGDFLSHVRVTMDAL